MIYWCMSSPTCTTLDTTTMCNPHGFGIDETCSGEALRDQSPARPKRARLLVASSRLSADLEVAVRSQLFVGHRGGGRMGNQAEGLTLHVANVLSVIRLIFTVAGVSLTTGNLAYATQSGAECYHNGHKIYIPDGLNYPRRAWAGWGISCRTPKPETAAESGATGAVSGERPVEWCGWWMRQHLGGHYGPEFNVARNWLNAGRSLDGPRPGAIGVKAHHVFQVVRVIDSGHVLAISGNDHNDVRIRIRPTSDVIGWRDVTEEPTSADKPAIDKTTADNSANKIETDRDADKADEADKAAAQ